MRIRDIGGGSYIIKGGSWYSSLFFFLYVFSFFFLQFLDFPELFFCTKIDIIWRDHEEQISKEFSIWKQESERSPHISFLIFFFHIKQEFHPHTDVKELGEGMERREDYIKFVITIIILSSYYNFSIIPN